MTWYKLRCVEPDPELLPGWRLVDGEAEALFEAGRCSECSHLIRLHYDRPPKQCRVQRCKCGM